MTPNEPNWKNLEIEVVERIRYLGALMGNKCDAAPELRGKIYGDLVLPNVRLLAEFCVNVQLEDLEAERA